MDSTTSYALTGLERARGFGYMWWIRDDAFMASGSGGHRILVMPDEEAVFVIRSDTDAGRAVSFDHFQQMMDMIPTAPSPKD